MGPAANLEKKLDVDSFGVFKCACDDDGAQPGQIHIRLGKYTFWPCMRCFRQIEGIVMQAVLTTGAKMAIEANIEKQELLGGKVNNELEGI